MCVSFMMIFMPKHLRENILHLCFLSKLQGNKTDRPIAQIFLHHDIIVHYVLLNQHPDSTVYWV